MVDPKEAAFFRMVCPDGAYVVVDNVWRKITRSPDGVEATACYPPERYLTAQLAACEGTPLPHWPELRALIEAGRKEIKP